MAWPALFTLTNVIALAGWAVLLLLPRGPAIRSIILYAGVGLLCLAYVAMGIALASGLADSVRLARAPEPDLADYSISGLRALFFSDGGLVVGWTHYLAFDLFVGLWVALDADSKGFSRWAQAPILLLILFAGPLGLLAWLMIREPAARAAAKRAHQ